MDTTIYVLSDKITGRAIVVSHDVGELVALKTPEWDLVRGDFGGSNLSELVSSETNRRAYARLVSGLLPNVPESKAMQ